jgi:hypothetical protein
MGYYIRVLGTSNPHVHLNELVDGLTSECLIAKFELDPRESQETWTVLNVLNEKGDELIRISRNSIGDDDGLMNEELEEFREEILGCKPDSAVKWLDNYFDKIKVIYAFQLLSAASKEENIPIVNCLKLIIWKKVGGILQADDEGFSNEKGSHILWQFSDNATGEWIMAVKNFLGKWKNFAMDLGDPHQREEFWAGQVPKDAIRFK